MSSYYRNRNYKKKSSKNKPLNRKLQLFCTKHGELVGYTSSDKIVIYESFNPSKNIIELKCFKCLDEQIQAEKERFSAIYSEADIQGYKLYGRRAKIYEYIGNTLIFTGFFGYFYFMNLFGWLGALIPTGLLFVLSFIIINNSERIQKQYIDYRDKNTKGLNYILPAWQEVQQEAKFVYKWRLEQARIKKERINYSFEEIDKMTGVQFENFVKVLLEKLGYENVQVTKASGDEGVDILAYRNGKKIAVQCKRYSSKLTNSAIQEVFSGKHFYNCQEAYVITNSYFTENAQILAKKHKVELIDRDRLFDLVESVNGSSNNNSLEHQIEFNL
ncbi:restriction endonuclease [Mesobacillus subterraneus]|uniref:restriction endonuclease n=1 Tax=Mesobacillus subterraneus TaxID=285983 RepID=UPI001CFF25F1|nr:restriction endonuclease [Mesobacillus subterraneus]WLR53786.1 restriction endonuclease [Mesobacillus subterraneus]